MGGDTAGPCGGRIRDGDAADSSAVARGIAPGADAGRIEGAAVMGGVRNSADRADIVQILQRACRGWLVIWSPWRQTYTGFACFTRERVIVDEAKVERFLDRIQQFEQMNGFAVVNPTRKAS
jgi:hypothetical protein